MGAHRRDEFHPLVQDVAAGIHRGGVGRGGPGACGSTKAWFGFFTTEYFSSVHCIILFKTEKKVHASYSKEKKKALFTIEF